MALGQPLELVKHLGAARLDAAMIGINRRGGIIGGRARIGHHQPDVVVQRRLVSLAHHQVVSPPSAVARWQCIASTVTMVHSAPQSEAHNTMNKTS